MSTRLVSDAEFEANDRERHARKLQEWHVEEVTVLTLLRLCGRAYAGEVARALSLSLTKAAKALRRLEDEGKLTSEMVPDPNPKGVRHRRYYRCTG